ncbi:MAG: TetR/AcrR family transcriptional regulator [Blautia sp.]
MKKELTIKQKRVMMYFIMAAKELMEQEGVEKLTVRKVATAAGYNSATLYNYFEDMEELVVFSSIGYLKEYIARLEKAIKPDMNAKQRYRTIYEVFGNVCFGRPEIYYSLFYGKYRKKLKNVISVYYEVFPDDLGHHDGEVLQMLKGDEITERDKAIMPSLVEQGFVAEANMEQTVTLVVRMFQSYLYDACMENSKEGSDKKLEEFLNTFDYIMEKAKTVS